MTLLSDADVKSLMREVDIIALSEFRDYIHKSFQAVYYSIPLEAARSVFITREDVKQFYRENMKYPWKVVHERGSIELGVCNQAEALAKCAEVMPKSTVVRVDPIFPFIFVTTPRA